MVNNSGRNYPFTDKSEYADGGDEGEPCPHCSRIVAMTAAVCPHCGGDVADGTCNRRGKTRELTEHESSVTLQKILIPCLNREERYVTTAKAQAACELWVEKTATRVDEGPELLIESQSAREFIEQYGFHSLAELSSSQSFDDKEVDKLLELGAQKNAFLPESKRKVVFINESGDSLDSKERVEDLLSDDNVTPIPGIIKVGKQANERRSTEINGDDQKPTIYCENCGADQLHTDKQLHSENNHLVIKGLCVECGEPNSKSSNPDNQ